MDEINSSATYFVQINCALSSKYGWPADEKILRAYTNGVAPDQLRSHASAQDRCY